MNFESFGIKNCFDIDSSPTTNNSFLARVNATKSVLIDSSAISSFRSIPADFVIDVVIASIQLVLFAAPEDDGM